MVGRREGYIKSYFQKLIPDSELCDVMQVRISLGGGWGVKTRMSF